MGKINGANLKKAFYYLKRNGLKNTWYAASERLTDRENASYCFIPPSSKQLEIQREKASGFSACFSIVVPTYRTRENYLREMIDSVIGQSYPKWELILADATEDDSVEKIIRVYKDTRIRFIKLEQNLGIAENTNRALEYVTKSYTALLDHDDVLTEDALFEMAEQIEMGKNKGTELKMLYSDEDKCNGARTLYYEPNLKEKFNLDLLLSNNYICHLLVLESSLIKELGFRKEYDGAQDYDLILRAAEKLMEDESQIVHVSKVLYHWRCHTDSTAQNPQSKQYAYEAGRRAVQDFADRKGWRAKAVDLKHLGFYGLEYATSALEERKDLGAVGGKLLERGKIAGGRYGEDGSVYYKGLPAVYGGYLHKAVLQQDALAVDIRMVMVRRECRTLFQQIVGVPYVTLPGQETFDASVLPEGADIPSLSLAFGKALHRAGYRVLWQPSWTKKCGRNGI